MTEGRRDGGEAQRVLVVDDDELVLAVLYHSLRMGECEVLAASGPAEALQLAAQFAGRIHLLVTDLMMPGLDGAELARQLARQLPDLKVLYITGYGREDLAEMGVRLDPWPLVRKPVSLEALHAAVRAALAAPPETDE